MRGTVLRWAAAAVCGVAVAAGVARYERSAAGGASGGGFADSAAGGVSDSGFVDSAPLSASNSGFTNSAPVGANGADFADSTPLSASATASADSAGRSEHGAGAATGALPGTPAAAPVPPVARRWCDGTFIAAVLLLSAGTLTALSRMGSFDALHYALTKLASRLRRSPDGVPRTYFDYVQEQRRKLQPHIAHLLGTGAVFLAAAFVLLRWA